MVRFLGIGAGLVFVLTLLVSFLVPRTAAVPDPVKALHLYPREVQFQHDGPMGMGVFGTFDRAQLQRGYQVYREVCGACHGLKYVAFRSLADLGFSEAEVRAIARSKEVPTINPETGEQDVRPGIPADTWPDPFPNETVARLANNNALPPDLSLIVKARPNGQAYVYSLLVGYDYPVPAGHDVPVGLHFNPYFPSVNIAMAKPLNEGQVQYADGTPATVDQMARDVTAFLRWTSQPELERRRQAGVATMIFLAILSVLAFFSYRRVWASIKQK
jgi:ubiquinol-cytochrome c reductase cytochrome c1 subunit